MNDEAPLYVVDEKSPGYTMCLVNHKTPRCSARRFGSSSAAVRRLCACIPIATPGKTKTAIEMSEKWDRMVAKLRPQHVQR